MCSRTKTENTNQLSPIMNMGMRTNGHCGARRSLENGTVHESGLSRVHAPLTYLAKDFTDLGSWVFEGIKTR